MFGVIAEDPAAAAAAVSRTLQFVEQVGDTNNEDAAISTDIVFYVFLITTVPFVVLAPLYALYLYFRPPAAPPDVTELELRYQRELRYQVIEARLISKRVVAHDELCDEVVAPSSDAESVSVDTNGKECMICFEPFEPDDIVSWSFTCEHVSHHACIKAWLLKHDSCPSCRQTILPLDATLKHGEKANSSTDCFYCQQHGLVRLKSLSLRDTSRELCKRAAHTCSPKILAQHGRQVIETETPIDTDGASVSNNSVGSSSSQPQLDLPQTGTDVHISIPSVSSLNVDDDDDSQLELSV
uniref:RING-type domain-containing protein n=1 Tax=Attheya septentrionalis TaxID=420275 RepID=A0A7S2UR05_9STRA|mmetsp:Transcript_8769/g.15915  ORF Transcript_8769/g.15915 Transcript_8769/m.15915 type:complete len:297 (+) Transcript_8769:133-1023(+)